MRADAHAPSRRGGVRPYLWMLCGALSFAVMGAAAHALRQELDWTEIALGRVIVPLLVVGVWCFAARVPIVVLRPASLWMRSIAGSISLVCAFFALTHLPVSEAITLTNLYPVWVGLLSWPLLGRMPGREVWIAVAAGVAGVVLLQQPQSVQGSPAVLAALGSSLGAAVAMIGLHKLADVDVRAIVFHFSAVSLAFCIAAVLLTEGAHFAFASASAGTLTLLFGVGVTALLGQIFITLAFASGPPANVSVVGLTQVGFAMLLDVLFWGRSFQIVSIAGIALIIGPTAWLLWSQRGARLIIASERAADSSTTERAADSATSGGGLPSPDSP